MPVTVLSLPVLTYPLTSRPHTLRTHPSAEPSHRAAPRPDAQAAPSRWPAAARGRSRGNPGPCAWPGVRHGGTVRLTASVARRPKQGHI